MLINEEDKIQYNLIEDLEHERIIGTVENIKAFLEDMIVFNGVDEEEEKEIGTIINNLNIYVKLGKISNNTIVATFYNQMCGLDWQIVSYEYA